MIQVTEETFEAETIRRSVKHPVVVELYSPRVATGHQLSDALIEIANSSDGKFLLARLNVDGAPGIVQALGLQAVPTVIALINGQVAPLFQGVLPKEQVQAAIDQLLKAAVANGIVGRAEPTGAPASADPPAAEPEPDPRFAAADEALARGDFAVGGGRVRQAARGQSRRRRGAGRQGPGGAVRPGHPLRPADRAGRGRAPTTGVGVQLDAADVEMVNGQVEAAFERLIGLIRTKAGDERNQVRVRLLELFETVGNADPRVLKARRDLMTALF